MASPLNDFLQWLRINNINMTREHWISKRNLYCSLKNMMKEEGVLLPGYKLVRTCRASGCLNPLHYRVVPDMKNYPNATEVEELAEIIDLDVCENIGFEAYLVLFNEDNPLPATREDMQAAVSIALSRAKRPIPLDNKFWTEGGTK